MIRCGGDGPMRASAPTNTNEVQRKNGGLNPLRRCAPAPLDAIKGSLWADRVVRPYNRFPAGEDAERVRNARPAYPAV